MIPSLLVAASLVSPLQRGLTYPDDGRFVRSGDHYEVHVHFDDKPALVKALDVCERAWPITMGLLGVAEDYVPEWPPALHVYPSKDAYVGIEAQLTKGAFRDNESFSHWDTRTAHVALAPPLPREARTEILLSAQSQEVIAHEAAHLAVYSVVPSYRWHPTWLGEGLALVVEVEVARALGLVDDPSEHPRFSSNQLHVQRMLSEDRLPPLDDLLMDTIDALTTKDRYALWHEFIEVLRADRQRFEELIEMLRTTRGGPQMRRTIADFVLETWGEKTLERRLRKRIEALDPKWEQVVRSLDTSGDQWIQTAFPDFDAEAWRRHPVGRPRYALEGTFTPLSPGTWMSVMVGRSAEGHVTVRFGQDRLEVIVHENGSARPLHPIPIERIARGHGTSFRVEVDVLSLRIAVDGDILLEVSLPRKLEGSWGLGVERGGAGRWSSVRLRS